MPETRTLGALLADAAVRHTDLTYIESDEGSLSFAEMHERANAAARDLNNLGVKRGDRISMLVSNRPEFLVASSALPGWVHPWFRWIRRAPQSRSPGC
jgi:acyl-CoA synthetase (AMP-forming)/AMP-acid ligase II